MRGDSDEMSTNTNTEKGHQPLLSQLITRLETQELRFYRCSASFNYWAWHITAGIAFLSSVITALVAALIGEAEFKSYGKILLIIVPIVGAAAAGLLHLYKFREKEALREEGRIELDDIIANAKSLMAAAASEEDYKKAYHSVRERFRQLELSQHRRDIALRSDEIPKVKTLGHNE